MSELPISEKTFENFIVDKSNRFAIAVCRGMVEEEISYNPLILYGKSGLGKSHLLKAMASAYHDRSNKNNIGFFIIEEIISDYIYQRKILNIDAEKIVFGEKCYKYDLVLIEGIEYLCGKEATQEEFFFLINNLVSKNKKVVMTSTESPERIMPLRELLVNRIESTLFCDIGEPSYDLRVKYCRITAEDAGLKLSEKEIEFISKKFEKLGAIHGELMRLKFLNDLK